MSEISKVGVVGAGMMGAEIALCFAKADYNVVMAARTPEGLERGKKRQSDVLDKSIAKGKLEEAKKEEILSKITATNDFEKMSDCDLIVEAVVEVLDTKEDTYKKLDSICKPDCIFASNTSSISITKLAAFVSEERVDKFIGTHFNSPASVMKLVEVVPALLTSEETTKTIMNVLYTIEKEPVKIKDVVGFGLNRLFHVFYAEACRLIEEDVCSIEDVDKICVYGLGHPVGIFKLLDMTGHDLNIKVDQIMFDAYGERFRPSQYMQKLVDAGYLGRKTKRGFYRYEK